MADGSAIIAPVPDDPEGRTARQLAMLQELAEIGMQIARAVRDEALATDAPADDDAPKRPSRFGNGDLGLVYSRIARAVRQTVALETRVAEGGQKACLERDQRHAAAVRWAAHERRAEIRGYVTEAIEAEGVQHGASDHEVDRLLDDLEDRIEAYDPLLGDAPMGEVVARICADLGIVPDWSLWDGHAWAAEHLMARACEDVGAERWRQLETEPAATDPPPPDDPPPDSG
jgi:hypothetical protein